MKKKYFLCFILVICLFFTSGCDSPTHGRSIFAITQRMNEYSPQYEISSEGFIFNKEKNSYSRYFKIGKEELLLKLIADHKSRINEAHIIIPASLHKNTTVLAFVDAFTVAFADDTYSANELMKEAHKHFKSDTPAPETKSAESGNVKTEIDITLLNNPSLSN